jgi:hypothetical protein
MATPLLHLEKWRDIMSFHPYHFWQWSNNADVPLLASCNSLVREYAWQNAGAAGRVEIRRAIAQAEDRLKEYLGYSISPHWVTETIYLPDGVPSVVRLQESKLLSIGTVNYQAVSDVAITLSKTVAAGLYDTFTLTFPLPTGSTISDMAVVFTLADRSRDTSDLQRWQLPVQLSLSGTTVTAIGKSWLLAKPVLYEGVILGDAVIDPTDLTNYVTSLSIYKRVITDTNIATLSYDACGTITSYSVCATILNAETGQVLLSPQQGVDYMLPCDCGCGCYGSHFLQSHFAQACKISITYRAGASVAEWENIIAYLAAAELQRKICGCEDASNELKNWQANMALAETTSNMNGERYRVPDSVLANPFGTRKGHLYAWEMVKDLYTMIGIPV